MSPALFFFENGEDQPPSSSDAGEITGAPICTFTLMLRATLCFAAFTAASSAAVELTPENFDKEVFQSGKAAFIKFLAPW